MKKKHMQTLILGVVVLLVLTGSLFTANSDREIESNAKKSYLFKNYLKNNDIQINCQNGVVTLTGTVPDQSQITLAADFFQGMSGVKRVENQLQVSGQMPEKNSDEWYRSRIYSMLMLRSTVNQENTQVEVKDGRVTIRGEAGSNAAKEMITEYIKDIEGLKNVENQMTVMKETPKNPVENIDDASIRAMSIMALSFHSGTSPFKATITVKKGVVTVTGNVNSATEQEWVTRRLENIHGVRRVNNRLTVGY